MARAVTPLYLERHIDVQLRSMASWWLTASQRTHWVTLSSEPGRGNTSLLRHFAAFLRESKEFRSQFATILVSDESARLWDFSPPRRLGPLATELHSLYAASRLTRLRRIGRRLQQASFSQLAGGLFIFLTAYALSVLVGGYSVYVTLPEVEPMSFRSLVDFFGAYIPRTWHKFPVWLMTMIIAPVPLSMALPLVRKLLLPGLGPTASSEQEIQPFETPQGLTEGILDICHGRRGLVMLIDDFRRLPDKEAYFLHRLFGFGAAPPLDLGERHLRFIAFAVDWHEEGRGHPLEAPKEQRQLVPVPAFDPIELHTILQATFSDAQRANINEKELLVEAHGSVNPLFAAFDHLLVEEMGNEFQKARDHGFAGFFDLDEIIAYQAAQQVSYVTKEDLLGWLTDPDVLGAHLREFGIKMVESGEAKELVRQFSECSLVRTIGATCHFDLARSAATRSWLRDNDLPLLARAHYYWFWRYWRELGAAAEAQDVTSLPGEQRQQIQLAAWHAFWVLGQKGASDLLSQVSGIDELERSRRRRELVRALLASAALCRAEATLGRSTELIVAALGSLGPGDEEVRCSAIDQLWRNYWLSGGPQLRREIEQRLARPPQLHVWPIEVHGRFEELLEGRATLSPSRGESELGDPFLIDLHRLTEVIWTIRRNQGFVAHGPEDASIEVAAPVATTCSIPEIQLRYLGCVAKLRRSAFSDFRGSLLAWRDRLVAANSVAGRLGDEACQLMSLATYSHLLVEAWRMTLPVGEAAEAPTGADELDETLRSAGFDTATAGADPARLAWEQSRAAYERVRYLAGDLLRWHPLLLAAEFGLARLMLDAADSATIREPRWQKSWDNLLSRCIDLETSLRWNFYKPEIHLLRFNLYRQISSEVSVEDAFNTLVAIRAAHFPLRIVLGWHVRVAGLVNDHANSDDDHRRNAELHQEWARALARLPEADGLRSFSRLEHEQANALLFAAQARRKLHQPGPAEKLLDEADNLFRSAPPQAKTQAEASAVRALQIRLRLQRAWILDEEDRHQEYGELIREIWREIRRGDVDVASVLGSLTAIEDREHSLDDKWPLSMGAAADSDPDNVSLSLPPGWRGGSAGAEAATRIEFRLQQLLSLLPPLLRLDQSRQAELRFRARRGWGVLQFGKIWLKLSTIAANRPLSSSTRELVTEVLDAVWFYFAEVEKANSKELEALRLLMHFVQGTSFYRERYVDALAKYENLLKHEVVAQAVSEQPDWMVPANQVDFYLRPLVDEDLLWRRVSAALQGERATEDLMKRLADRRPMLERARAAYSQGEQATCGALLQGALPPSDPPWVFHEDLEILDLWLKCQARQGSNGREYSERAEQLRRLALRFIGQFSGTIREPQIQQLVLELLDAAARFAPPAKI